MGEHEEMTIQEYIRKNYPDKWNSGKWGCQRVGLKSEAECQKVEEEFPHGFRVSVGVTDKYWVWFDHD